MKSELTFEFLALFRKLPTRIKQTARKNYRLWKQNPRHPSIEFKKLNTSMPLYSVRAGIGWRAVGVMKELDTMVWYGSGLVHTRITTSCLKVCENAALTS